MAHALHHLHKNVWYRPCHPDKNRVEPAIGVVVGDDATILIDAGNSPRQAAAVITAVSQLHAPPIRHIIYTHHHWDHTFGAFTYPEEVTIIGHKRTHQIMTVMMAEPWSSSYLRRRIERNPDLILDWTEAEWRQFRLIPPHITFEQPQTLSLAGVTFHLEHVGGNHAADSIVIKIPEAGVAFLGDCYYPAPVYAGGNLQDPVDTAVLAHILDEEITIYVDGHKAPFTRRQLQRIVRSHGLVAGIGKNKD